MCNSWYVVSFWNALSKVTDLMRSQNIAAVLDVGFHLPLDRALDINIVTKYRFIRW